MKRALVLSALALGLLAGCGEGFDLDGIITPEERTCLIQGGAANFDKMTIEQAKVIAEGCGVTVEELVAAVVAATE
jgi:hypothetical protein